jgi:hypothetical protein
MMFAKYQNKQQRTGAGTLLTPDDMRAYQLGCEAAMNSLPPNTCTLQDEQMSMMWMEGYERTMGNITGKKRL